MAPLRFGLVTVHIGAGALWLGAMAYSLTVVQPRAQSFLTATRRYEELAATLAAGARWRVLALWTVLVVSGGGLIVVEALDPRYRSAATWSTLVAVKTLAMLVALALFVRVSWRLWPARILAGDREVAALQRRFGRIGVALTTLVAVDLVLGVATATLA